MNLAEAAATIGCSTNQLRRLVSLGSLPATKRKSRNNQHGFEYEVTITAARKAWRNRRLPGRPKQGVEL